MLMSVACALADSSDFGLLGEQSKVTKNVRFSALDADEQQCKI